MSVTVKGRRELQARMTAISDTSKFLREFAPHGIRQIKIETPRRTGNLSRLNAIDSVGDKEVRFSNRASYAVPVHQGSRPHTIFPRRAEALSWPADRASARLTGSVRRGGRRIFARKVKHPGNKPNPWMLRGLRIALERVGLGKIIVKVWDAAA